MAALTVESERSLARGNLSGEDTEPSRLGDVFALYLREVGRIPLLTHEQEVDLARRARLGDTGGHEFLG